MQGNVAEAQPARGNPVLLRMGLVIIQFFDQTPTGHTTLSALRLVRSECHEAEYHVFAVDRKSTV